MGKLLLYIWESFFPGALGLPMLDPCLKLGILNRYSASRQESIIFNL